MIEEKQIEPAHEDLAGQKCCKIAIHAQEGNQKYSNAETENKTGQLGAKCQGGHTHTMQNAGKNAVQIQKRAEP